MKNRRRERGREEAEEKEERYGYYEFVWIVMDCIDFWTIAWVLVVPFLGFS